MAAAPENYAGREQAYVKHFLLRNYFSDLIHKIASAYNEIAYIDGFSGPWQSVDESMGDTSFGIALAAMRSAKQVWATKGRNVRMQAFLVERRSSAFNELAKVSAIYPEIDIRTYHGRFVELVPTILGDMSPRAFAFIFIDPKGWRINIDSIAPLLQWPNAEVLYNFMFDFINRAAPMADPAIVAGLDELIKSPGWRERLASAKPDAASRIADVRKQILVEAFADTLAAIGGYRFVAETPVFRPVADRTLYCLVYATRKAVGIEVFRSTQIKTLREQEAVRGAVRQARRSGAQLEAFAPSEMAASETEAYLAAERLAAQEAVLALASGTQNMALTYGDIWPKVLARHSITRADLNRVVAALRKAGRLICPDWAIGRRVPSDAWRLYARD